MKYLTAEEAIKYLLLKTGVGIINRKFYKNYFEVLKEKLTDLKRHNIKIYRRGDTLHLVKGRTKYILRIHTSDLEVFKQVVLNEEYGPLNSIAGTCGIQDPKVIVDAGANIGMTVLFLKGIFPNSRIVALEPESDNFRQLRKNVAENGFEESTDLLQSALWISNSDTLYISHDFRDGNSWAKAVTSTPNKNQQVLSIDLAGIMGSIDQCTVIDILKMDIEGAESVLFSDNDFLDQLANHVRLLCVEIHEELQDKPRILRILTELNFSFEIISETVFAINKNLIAN